MIDLTGANLVAYLLRIVKDAVERNPRFRSSLGEVTFASNNSIHWGDVQVIVKSITSQGNRLSPDYFMFTQHGRAILAKVAGKEGSFVEWVNETDKTRVTPPAGVYYFNVDAVDERTQDVNLTVQRYRWEQGHFRNAEGTTVVFAPGIDGRLVTCSDLDNPDETVNTNAFQKFLYLLSPVNQLVCTGITGGTGATGSYTLVPNQDYWILRKQTVSLKTTGGGELVEFPPKIQNYTDVQIFDETGYQLRLNLDYHFQGPEWIKLEDSTPAGSQLSIVASVKMNPATTIPATNPENIIPVTLNTGESLAPGEVFISTTSGDYTTAVVSPENTIVLPILMQPGEWYHYDLRILSEMFTVVGKKYQLNGFWKTIWDPKANVEDPNYPKGSYVVYLDPDTNQPVNPIPGMVLAIGDAVVKDDQCAIICSPSLTETYQVYGSKEQLSFVLDCKANDFQTASDISELLKRELLILRRENMEADGVTIFEATRSNLGEQRDPSGTAPRFVFTLSVTASADWKVFVPVVTRFARYELSTILTTSQYRGKLLRNPRLKAFGQYRFIEEEYHHGAAKFLPFYG